MRGLNGQSLENSLQKVRHTTYLLVENMASGTLHYQYEKESNEIKHNKNKTSIAISLYTILYIYQREEKEYVDQRSDIKEK